MLWLQEGQRLLQGGHPASEAIQEQLQELGALWGELQDNFQKKVAKLQNACEVSLCGPWGGWPGSGPLPSCQPCFLP